MYDSTAHASVTHRTRRMCRTHTGNVNYATHWHDAFLSLVMYRTTSCRTHQAVMSPSLHHELAEHMKVCETCHIWPIPLLCYDIPGWVTWQIRRSHVTHHTQWKCSAHIGMRNIPRMTYSSFVSLHIGMSQVSGTHRKDSCDASYAVKVQSTYRKASHDTHDTFL